MIVLGLAGFKRTGKDTVAARLVERHGFTRFAFADPLKEAALALDPIVEFSIGVAAPGVYRSVSQIRLSEIVNDHGWEKAKAFPEVRRTLQRFGVGIREIDSEFWVRALVGAVEASGAERVVITDVRFPNEVTAVRVQLGGEVTLVTRPGTSSDGHVSESLPDTLVPDSVIANDSDIATLYREVDSLADHLDHFYRS